MPIRCDFDIKNVIFCPAERASRANRWFWRQKRVFLPSGACLESKSVILTSKMWFFAQRSVPWEQIGDFDAKNLIFCPAERALRANWWFWRQKHDFLPSGACLESKSMILTQKMWFFKPTWTSLSFVEIWRKYHRWKALGELLLVVITRGSENKTKKHNFEAQIVKQKKWKMMMNLIGICPIDAKLCMRLGNQKIYNSRYVGGGLGIV